MLDLLLIANPPRLTEVLEISSVGKGKRELWEVEEGSFLVD